MPFQYILYRIQRNDVTDISQCAWYSVVAPADIFPRHA